MAKFFEEVAAIEEAELQGSSITASVEELTMHFIEQESLEAEIAVEEAEIAKTVSAVKSAIETYDMAMERIANEEAITEVNAGVAQMALASMKQTFQLLGAEDAMPYMPSTESIESNPETAFKAAIEEEKNFLQKIWDKIKAVAKKLWIKVKNVVGKIIIAITNVEKTTKALEEAWNKKDKVLADDSKNKFEEKNKKSVKKQLGTMIAALKKAPAKGDVSVCEEAINKAGNIANEYAGFATEVSKSVLDGAAKMATDIVDNGNTEADVLNMFKGIKLNEKELVALVVEKYNNNAKKDEDKIDEKKAVIVPIRFDHLTLRAAIVTAKEYKGGDKTYYIPKIEYFEIGLKDSDVKTDPELLDAGAIDKLVASLVKSGKQGELVKKQTQVAGKILEQAVENSKGLKELATISANVNASSDDEKAKAKKVATISTNFLNAFVQPMSTYGAKIQIDITLNFLNNVKGAVAVAKESMKFYK